jgi:hypothetical protein
MTTAGVIAMAPSRKYKSKYTDKLITTAQHLAEMMCERMARKDKKELAEQFWNKPPWKRTYLHQVQIAHGLLKLYAEEAILNVLAKNPTVYSLNAQFLDPYFKAEQERLQHIEDKPAREESTPLPNVNAKPRPNFQPKKSVLSKLRGLDG